MDINDLRAFIAIAEEGSFTKAAKSLNVSQPPLSRQIQNLEAELGKTLFVRNSKGVALTEEGHLLRERAQEIIDLLEKAEREVSGSNAEIVGEISIGAGETQHFSLLAKAAAKLREAHPLISFSLYAGDAARIGERLEEGLLDFGLLIGDFSPEKYDFIPLPEKDHWGVLMRKDDPLAGHNSITKDDLRRKPLIMSHQASRNEEMLHFLGQSKRDLQIVATYDLIHNASIFVEEGLGYLIGLEGILKGEEERGLAFKRLDPPFEASLSLVYKKGKTLSRAAKAYLDCLLEEIRKPS